MHREDTLKKDRIYMGKDVAQKPREWGSQKVHVSWTPRDSKQLNFFLKPKIKLQTCLNKMKAGSAFQVTACGQGKKKASLD